MVWFVGGISNITTVIVLVIGLLFLLYLLFRFLIRSVPMVAGSIVAYTTLVLTLIFLILFYPFTNKRKEDFIKNPTSTRIAIFLWFIMWLMIAFIVFVLILVE